MYRLIAAGDMDEFLYTVSRRDRGEHAKRAAGDEMAWPEAEILSVLASRSIKSVPNSLRGLCFRDRFAPKFDVQQIILVTSKSGPFGVWVNNNIPSVEYVETVQSGQACRTSSSYTLLSYSMGFF